MKWEQILCPERERPSTSRAKADLRSEFEKDYHRIIASASFRRLQDKTQVYPLDQSDFVRTRLTHSLEVSSFARSLGYSIGERILVDGLDPAFTEKNREDMCSILQCAGLIHDIGNPPFGHFGETAIRHWFKEHLETLTWHGQSVGSLLTEQMKNDFYHFEGNAQALRLVTKLHYLLDEHGMNLTYGLLGAIIKYPTSSLDIDPDAGDIKRHKMGYYYAERDLFARIEEHTGTSGARDPLAFILEAADDIAYLTVDIEDAFVKNFIHYEELYEALKDIPEIRSAGNVFDPAAALQALYQRARDLGDFAPEEYAIKNWTVQAQNILISCATVSFAEHYEQIMNGTYTRELFDDTPAHALVERLSRTAYDYVFLTHPIFSMEEKESVMLNYLIEYFVHAVVEVGSEEEAELEHLMRIAPFISDNYVRAYRHWSAGRDEVEKLYLRLLLVTDYICGMTDSYAKRLYQRLTGTLQEP